MASPSETVNKLLEAINRGNLNDALALYEPDGVLVSQPGQIARASTELRDALAGFIAMKSVLRSEAQQVIERTDIALCISRWNLRGVDPAGKEVAMAGESTDILRRQKDGRWLIAIDNPWGVEILAHSSRT